MYRWLGERVVRWAIGHLVAGRPDRVAPLLAPDVSFRFPGSSSFGAERTGREAMLEWMRRFAALRPDYDVRDVVVSGPPWNMRVAVVFEDRIGEDYRNEGVQYLRMRWGRVRSEQVFLDTEAVSRWESRHPELTAGDATGQRATASTPAW